MSVRQALTELGANVLAMANTRLALFSLEAAQARQALFQLAGLAVAAVLCLTLALCIATLAVALYFWPTEYRFVALGILALTYLVVGLVLCWQLRARLAHGPAPFATTVAVLGEDVQGLRRPRRGANDAIAAASAQTGEPL